MAVLRESLAANLDLARRNAWSASRRQWPVLIQSEISGFGFSPLREIYYMNSAIQLANRHPNVKRFIQKANSVSARRWRILPKWVCHLRTAPVKFRSSRTAIVVVEWAHVDLMLAASLIS